MRCACRNCDAYMVHAEDSGMGCICPECGERCTDCLGTNTVISREKLSSLPDMDWLLRDLEMEFAEDKDKIK